MDVKMYPNFYQAADKAAFSAQNWYINIIRVDLVSMLAASALAVYNYKCTTFKLYAYSLTCFFLLLSLTLTIILLSRKFEITWYMGRALAESCKTLTWRFISCSELFEKSIPDIEAKNLFVKRIDELKDEFFEITKELNAKILNLPIVTDEMIDLRKKDLGERKAYYIEKRIKDQLDWYSDKAEKNKTWYNIWFSVILVSQIVGIISAIYLIKTPESNWNIIGFLTTIATAAISWLKLKQHLELKQAYTTATMELNSIESLSGEVSSEEDFSKFVLDSENAISREHTTWLAQRRK